MTNPFNKSATTTTAPAAAPASFGGNPFANLGGAQEDAPLTKPGMQARVVITNFRVVPQQIGSQVGDAVYVDFLIEEMPKAPDSQAFKVGTEASHRISGFTGTGAKFAAVELKTLFLCALQADGFDENSLNEVNPDGSLDQAKTYAAWAQFPLQVQAQGLLNGKQVWIETDAKGKTNKKTTAKFMPVG